jgi:hypothetical protein
MRRKCQHRGKKQEARGRFSCFFFIHTKTRQAQGRFSCFHFTYLKPHPHPTPPTNPLSKHIHHHRKRLIHPTQHPSLFTPLPQFPITHQQFGSDPQYTKASPYRGSGTIAHPFFIGIDLGLPFFHTSPVKTAMLCNKSK